MATIHPVMGAGLASLSFAGRPALRPWDGSDNPFALAMNLLVPFSNRIAGGFAFGGRAHMMGPNLKGEPFPIHGDGFQRPWTILSADEVSADLMLKMGQIGPFRHQARISYRLTPQALSCTLSVTHVGPDPLPYGLGFHPWFPRTPATRLRLNATGLWTEGEGHLRAAGRPDPLPDALRFTGTPLPDGWVNAGLSGWDGQAGITQGDGAASLSVTAQGLSVLILYSPATDAPFFCAEPVSHPVDAHNLPGRDGLTVLATGQTMTATMTLHHVA
jgi:aldose 1-epimerase